MLELDFYPNRNELSFIEGVKAVAPVNDINLKILKFEEYDDMLKHRVKRFEEAYRKKGVNTKILHTKTVPDAFSDAWKSGNRTEYEISIHSKSLDDISTEVSKGLGQHEGGHEKHLYDQGIESINITPRFHKSFKKICKMIDKWYSPYKDIVSSYEQQGNHIVADEFEEVLSGIAHWIPKFYYEYCAENLALNHGDKRVQEIFIRNGLLKTINNTRWLSPTEPESFIDSIQMLSVSHHAYAQIIPHLHEGTVKIDEIRCEDNLSEPQKYLFVLEKKDFETFPSFLEAVDEKVLATSDKNSTFFDFPRNAFKYSGKQLFAKM